MPSREPWVKTAVTGQRRNSVGNLVPVQASGDRVAAGEREGIPTAGEGFQICFALLPGLYSAPSFRSPATSASLSPSQFSST